MITYRNIENGKDYIFKVERVFVWRADSWKRVAHIRPADLAHYPYIGIKQH